MREKSRPFVFLFFGPTHAIDFSKKEGVAWYKEKLKGLFELGASVMKVDFGEQIQPHQEFSKYSGREMHNLYPLLYNKAAFEATEEHLGKGNAVIWARSAYAGSQRYPVHWSGDNSSNFPNMLTSLRAGLSLGLCGFTFWSQDTGGFVGIPDDKLYIRWTALSIFQSHMRFHGCEPRFREPWNFSTETQDIVRKFLELRYRLIPYIFSESIQAAREGLPLMRSFFLEFPDDPNTLNIEDQFCSGTKLLVAPILTEADRRRLYLPEGVWYNFWERKAIQGPKWIHEESALDEIPLYVKAGCFLPMGEVL
ncbi:MAG: alpha-xylosidase, partial [Spirochaetaceae bacterium]|nr:alpha-xylosidase [Spirochaetaceae bacterium]